VGRKRGDLVLSGFFGAFGLILTYLLTRFLAVQGGFWIALGVGAGITVLTFLCLAVCGLKNARKLDEWEERQTEAYRHRFSVRVLTASRMSECNLYLYPDRLVMVSPRRSWETALRREEINEIMAGTEDTELICDQRGLFSLDCGKESEETKILLEWYHKNQQEEE